MKIAILHDWLDKKAGAENVLEQILKIYPNSDLFVIVDHMENASRSFLDKRKVNVSFIQFLPFSKKHFRKYFFLFPLAVRLFNLKEYDLIISSSHSYVKNIYRDSQKQIHICYCYTPIRYCYDMKDDYLNDYFSNFFVKKIFSIILSLIKYWDKYSNKNIDHFVAISKHIQQRIEAEYNMNSHIIFPSIPFKNLYKIPMIKKDYYVAISRFVPYKKIDLIIKTFNKIPNKKIIIIGSGDFFNKYSRLAISKNIQFVGDVDDYDKFRILSSAKALIFPAYEDFGIVPVEAQACGTPVICYGKGGVLDTVIASGKNRTGLFFYKQTVDEIIKAIKIFELRYDKFSSENCKINAKKFDHSIFKNKLKRYINEYIKKKNGKGI